MEAIYANQSTSITDDTASQVLGKEHRDRVRELSCGITPTREIASVVGKLTIAQLREEMNAFKQQLQDLQNFVFNIQFQTNNREHIAGIDPSSSMHKPQYSSASNLSGGNRCVNIIETSAKHN
ncbi:hypothetical protein ACOSQ2_005265 [Xanthoceras sorbifolium]